MAWFRDHPKSGVSIQPKYADFDARAKFGRHFELMFPHPKKLPAAAAKSCAGFCPLKTAPYSALPVLLPRPTGPCMVSSEGACAAAYRFG